MPPLVSFALIVRNEEAKLPDCLESIAGIAGEIIVVDTGSTDRSKAVAAAFGAKACARRGSPDPAVSPDRRSPLAGRIPTVAPGAGSGDRRTARQPVVAPSRFRNPEPGYEPNGLPRLPCCPMLFITLNLPCAFDPQAVCDTFSERKL
jgi:glycosyltransferase involved in cell wall biosynthesis